MHSKLMTLVLVMAVAIMATTALAQDPIAHYPLAEDAVDITGIHADMDLVDCPFMDGGVYCNGDFWGFTLQTPVMDDMSRETLTFIFDFKMDNYASTNAPVMWLGYGWRTLGFEVSPEGYAGICTGNGDAFFVPSDVMVSLGEWHTGRISYSADMGFASCYLDGVLIMLAEREPISTSVDMRLLPKNGAYARAFDGFIKNLIVYNTDEPGTVATDVMTFDGVKSLYR